ncbi:MAG: ankyrin repeat domain-containing protein [Acidobacteriota bacterium]
MPYIVMEYVEGETLNNFQNKYGQTALMNAAFREKVDATRTLLDLSAETNVKDESGYTPLIIACRNGSTYIVYALITRAMLGRDLLCRC